MAQVGFAGDWHGNVGWAQLCLERFGHENIDTVYHVGDFGLWPGPEGEKYLTRVEQAAKRSNIRLYIVLGNHENYSRVKKMAETTGGWLQIKAYPHLFFAPRAHAWIDESGVRYAALGGAGSIDQIFRREEKTWWREEEITDTDVEAFRQACAHLSKTTGANRIDIMLSHEAPAGLERETQPLPNYVTPDVAHYCHAQRVRLREAADTAEPRWLIHGHWHEYFRDTYSGVNDFQNEYTCEVLGLDMDGKEKNCVIAITEPGVGVATFRFLSPRGGMLLPR